MPFAYNPYFALKPVRFRISFVDAIGDPQLGSTYTFTDPKGSQDYFISGDPTADEYNWGDLGGTWVTAAGAFPNIFELRLMAARVVVGPPYPDIVTGTTDIVFKRLLSKVPVTIEWDEQVEAFGGAIISTTTKTLTLNASETESPPMNVSAPAGEGLVYWLNFKAKFGGAA